MHTNKTCPLVATFTHLKRSFTTLGPLWTTSKTHTCQGSTLNSQHLILHNSLGEFSASWFYTQTCNSLKQSLPLLRAVADSTPSPFLWELLFWAGSRPALCALRAPTHFLPLTEEPSLPLTPKEEHIDMCYMMRILVALGKSAGPR